MGEFDNDVREKDLAGMIGRMKKLSIASSYPESVSPAPLYLHMLLAFSLQYSAILDDLPTLS